MSKTISKLIKSYLTGKISIDELNILKNEFNNPDHRKEFNEYLDIWQSAITARKTDDYDSEKAWQNFKFNIKYSNRKTQQESSVTWIKRLPQVAAAIIIMALLGTLAYSLLKNHGYPMNDGAVCEYIIPYGSRSQVILPDGSNIWLNSGTKLIYNRQFGRNNRNIKLEGEAYFDVTKNNELPFIVNTSELSIRVVGTAFNVKAYPEENYIETTVERGIVQIKGNHIKTANSNKIILKANQKLLYPKNSAIEENTINKIQNKTVPELNKNENSEAAFQVDQVSTKKYTSWKDNRWIIEREELQSLVVKLERRFNVSIIINDDNLKHYIFSGVLENETLEQVLEAIKLTAPIVYKIDQKQVILSRNIYFKPN